LVSSDFEHDAAVHRRLKRTRTNSVVNYCHVYSPRFHDATRSRRIRGSALSSLCAVTLVDCTAFHPASRFRDTHKGSCSRTLTNPALISTRHYLWHVVVMLMCGLGRSMFPHTHSGQHRRSARSHSPQQPTARRQQDHPHVPPTVSKKCGRTPRGVSHQNSELRT
jgi:hypothetical protein